MKLALVISSMGGGGAERVLALLANAWAEQRHAVTLITLSGCEDDVHRLDARVARVSLALAAPSGNQWKGLVANIRRILALRGALRDAQADVVVSFLTYTNILALLAARPLRLPVVISERISPNRRLRSGVWEFIRRRTYRLARIAVAQTTAAADWFRRYAPGVPVRIVLNPAAVVEEEPDVLARQVLHNCAGKHMVLALGRLAEQKGFDLLLDAFARVAPSHPNWQLVIAGEGSERAALEALVLKHDLAGRVFLPGFTRTPQALLRHADLFVLSSRYEGMPNALIDAMACGVACISFDCPTGPAQLIRHGISGWLVSPQNVLALALAMSRLIADVGLRVRLGREAMSGVEPYSANKVMQQWQEVLDIARLV